MCLSDFTGKILSLPYLSFLLVSERLFYSYVGQRIAFRVAIFCPVFGLVAQVASHEFFEGKTEKASKVGDAY